jgi:DNA-binding FrmR family transcriptional regulator
MEAVERALDSEIACVRDAVNGSMAEVMEDHIRFHVIDPAHEKNRERAEGSCAPIRVRREAQPS